MHESTDEHMLENILSNNDQLAKHNREHFDELGLWVLNIMSAPGGGKTSLLEASLTSLNKDYRCCVIEGDMHGELDAHRLRKLGVNVYQINTGSNCHLDAKMVAQLFHATRLEKTDCLFIENVGNLVYPAEFPLGEHKRVVLLSVAEGDDKPIKYPVIFGNCDAVVFTKCDLLPHVDFDIERATKAIKDLNPNVCIFTVSVVTKEGLDNLLSWIGSEIEEYKDKKRPKPHEYCHPDSP